MKPEIFSKIQKTAPPDKLYSLVSVIVNPTQILDVPRYSSVY